MRKKFHYALLITLYGKMNRHYKVLKRSTE